ncbi:MAG TPA: KTSC domain-containing protein [Vicinamibacterales bacterium]|nr:KTSC domain-containing protein [Vicinamibacterales bacterium]
MDSTLELAYDRGLRGTTFATADELQTPGYDEAWRRGREDGALMASRVAVSSSLLKSVGPYKDGALDLEFKSGHRYRCTGVPKEQFFGLLKADSPGAFFNTHIKGRYDITRIDLPKKAESQEAGAVASA